MTFTDKRNLLMVNEERLWRMDGKNMKDFDAKTFKIMSPDVTFDIPSVNL